MTCDAAERGEPARADQQWMPGHWVPTIRGPNLRRGPGGWDKRDMWGECLVSTDEYSWSLLNSSWVHILHYIFFKSPIILLWPFVRIYSHDDEYLVMFSLIKIFTAGRHGRPPDSGDPQWSAEWSAHPGGGDKLQLGGSGGLRLGNDQSVLLILMVLFCGIKSSWSNVFYDLWRS